MPCFFRISKACCSRIAGIWWCHIALVLVDFVSALSFQHAFPWYWLDDPNDGRTSQEGKGNLSQTVKVRELDSILLAVPRVDLSVKGLVGECSKLVIFRFPTVVSSGCVLGETEWEGIVGAALQACNSWGPAGLQGEVGRSWGLTSLRTKRQCQCQLMEVRGPCISHLCHLCPSLCLLYYFYFLFRC